MKTSNKLLVAAVLLLVTVAIVNALTLKSRFTVVLAHDRPEVRSFPAERFNIIEITGTAPRGNTGYQPLLVTVKRADSMYVTYSKMDFIRVEQVDDTLKVTVEHPKGYDGNVLVRPLIVIECPELIAINAIGTPLDSLNLPEDTHVLTRLHYQKSEVTVAGFDGMAMDVFAAEGMEITLDSLAVDSLSARAERAGTVQIRRNTLGHADLTVGDGATITLLHTQIGTVATAVAEKGQFIVKGTQLKALGARSVH
ncbi:hypothetical protein [Parapedobacter sp. 2B3]|uniref:hypothetical protein n=1 Tax=Parapedobacter sp. 2B3 TaxID=3342381 RepID=UPI0035B64BBB